MDSRHRPLAPPAGFRRANRGKTRAEGGAGQRAVHHRRPGSGYGRDGAQSRATPTSDLTTPISISKRDLVTWKKADIGFIRVRFFSHRPASGKPPRGAHTDPRIDAKLSHVQHSSTYKHGPSSDQAGTRRCVPHVAQRPEPFARHLFFPGNSRLAGYFPPLRATRVRDPRFRVSPPRRTSASVTYVSYPDGPSVRAVSGARCRPSPPVQRSSTRHANFANSRCAFRHFVSFFTQTLATGRAGARPTFTTTTANPARARLAPPSTSPTTAAATRSTSPSVADPSTSATTAAARAPSKVSTIRLCAERRTPLNTPMNTNAAGENEENDDGPTVHERCTITPPCTKLRLSLYGDLSLVNSARKNHRAAGEASLNMLTIASSPSVSASPPSFRLASSSSVGVMDLPRLNSTGDIHGSGLVSSFPVFPSKLKTSSLAYDAARLSHPPRRSAASEGGSRRWRRTATPPSTGSSSAWTPSRRRRRRRPSAPTPGAACGHPAGSSPP